MEFAHINAPAATIISTAVSKWKRNQGRLALSLIACGPRGGAGWLRKRRQRRQEWIVQCKCSLPNLPISKNTKFCHYWISHGSEVLIAAIHTHKLPHMTIYRPVLKPNLPQETRPPRPSSAPPSASGTGTRGAWGWRSWLAGLTFSTIADNEGPELSPWRMCMDERPRPAR